MKKFRGFGIKKHGSGHHPFRAFMMCAGHDTYADKRFTVIGRKDDTNKARAIPGMGCPEEA
jgi:hypothetical protein